DGDRRGLGDRLHGQAPPRLCGDGGSRLPLLLRRRHPGPGERTLVSCPSSFGWWDRRPAGPERAATGGTPVPPTCPMKVDGTLVFRQPSIDGFSKPEAQARERLTLSTTRQSKVDA